MAKTVAIHHKIVSAVIYYAELYKEKPKDYVCSHSELLEHCLMA
jgi:hypothetical protein